MTWVDSILADALRGFGGSGFTVSAALEGDFAAWVTWFKREAIGDSALSMVWREFHRQGISLARRLKAELGDQVRVVYDTPVEDPACDAGSDTRMEVLAGGELKQPVVFRRNRRPISPTASSGDVEL